MIPVFYRPEQNSPATESPSARKPQFVVESWLKQFPRQLEVKTFRPTTPAEFARVHSPEYVLGVLQNRQENGFGTIDPAVTVSLPYTTGSLVAAAAHVMQRGGVAVSPTSGFHHAGYDFGGGYCTFNGLMVAATQFKTPKPRVAILDCDQHYGNGTVDILFQLQWRFIKNYGGQPTTKPRPFSVYYPWLEETLQHLVKQGVDLVIYQAGADQHINDPYGGAYTSSELQRRDALVFQVCKEAQIPLVWNLAGGYQTDKNADPNNYTALMRPVLDIHDTTMRECLKVYSNPTKEKS